MGAAIEAQDLTRHFGDLAAVERISFRVEEGEVFGLLGPNGAGKTTTVRMLTGVITPTGGTARVQGHDIRTEPLAAREHLGVVPEEANVYMDLGVWRNVMLMAELHGVPRARRLKEGERLLDLLGLADRRKQKARALSKGLRQRLMLASALVSEPQVLFLDEPTSGLDVQSARLIRQIVREMNRDGLTVFLTTHNMAEAEEMCSRVAIIHKGRLAAVDTPLQLRTRVRAAQRVEVRFAGEPLDGETLRSLAGVSGVREMNGSYSLRTEMPGRVALELARLCTERQVELAELCTRKPGLEEVFLQLTGQEQSR